MCACLRLKASLPESEGGETDPTVLRGRSAASEGPPWQSAESFSTPVPSLDVRRQPKTANAPPAAAGGGGAGGPTAAGAAASRGNGKCRYILKPLHVRLTIAHQAAQQELVARLEVLRESHGVSIGKAQLSALLQLMHEASARTKRCERLLLREARSVCLSPEALEGDGETQKEFVSLYSRKLQAEAGVRGVQPLTDKEEKRLSILHDVVGVRHVSLLRRAWCGVLRVGLLLLLGGQLERQSAEVRAFGLHACSLRSGGISAERR